jgi:hypothetical protein
VHLVLGAAVLAVIVLLALSVPATERGRKGIENTVLGALAVGAMVLVLTKAGMPWLAIALALFFTSAKRFTGKKRSPDPDAPRAREGGRRGDEMTREEAYKVLGLSPDATREQIVTEYRRLMKRVHPDQGGTTYLASRLNQAKDRLLDDPGKSPEGKG